MNLLEARRKNNSYEEVYGDQKTAFDPHWSTAGDKAVWHRMEYATKASIANRQYPSASTVQGSMAVISGQAGYEKMGYTHGMQDFKTARANLPLTGLDVFQSREMTEMPYMPSASDGMGLTLILLVMGLVIATQ